MKRYSYSKEELNLIENNPFPLAIYQYVDKRLVTIALSQGFLELFKYDDRQEAYDMMNNNMYAHAHPDDMARIADAAHQFATYDATYDVLFRDNIKGEYRIIRAVGKHIYKPTGDRLAIVTYFDEGPYVETPEGEGGAAAYSLSRSVNEDSKNYNKSYDYLTGLPQMTYFFELAIAGRDSIVKDGDKPVVLYFDLSGMKMFNQKYGYTEGDKLLRKVADVLIKHFSANNCSRFTGDQFAVYTGQKNLDEQLNTILDEIENVNSGNSLPVRIGVYKARDLFVDASVACDRAKVACDSTKGSYVSAINYYDEKMLQKEEIRQYVLSNLDRALSEGWIKVFYQAIVRSSNDRVCDEEALARWQDPERGMIFPGDFISVLEESGIIYKLDLYVIEQVIKKIKQQRDEGLYVVPQSINLSRTDFYSCDIVEEIRKRMDDVGLDHSLLTIEITESVIGRDFVFMKTQITRFEDLGFKIWMDDYGSGYSSPELLQKIHFDTIKFDMQYMRDFNNGPANRIILTELIKMAVALGIETVVEGVETAEQVEFLKEVGCSKLQGYYYTRPVPMEKILDRSQKGTLIGFENPNEAEYYSVIGKVNLYDLAITHEEKSDELINSYFNALPMAIFEMDDEYLWVSRANPSYKSFFKLNIRDNANLVNERKNIEKLSEEDRTILPRILRQCAKDGQRVIFDEKGPEGAHIHVFVRRVAVNPVTGVVALAVVILGVENSSEKNNLNYNIIAQALTSDYISLYHVDLETENFVEYGSGNAYDELNIERHGTDFFNLCHKEILMQIYDEDKESFFKSFTMENVIAAMDQTGAYTYSFRLYIKDEPIFVHLKAVRIKGDDNNIIISISNIDEQKKQQESFERIKEERSTYSRIAALSGSYIVIFTVDPYTGNYTNYVVNKNYVRPKMAGTGDNFLEKFRAACEELVYPEDLERVLEELQMDNIKSQINDFGIFKMTFRDIHSGDPRYVELRVALVDERDGKKILFGIRDVHDQVKREQEAASKLTAARNEASLDALTGVKNKHAYIDVETQLNEQITLNNAPAFAVVVLDINGLKTINDSLGHKAGDDHIKKGCQIICKIFRHSPVFRIGGDEFAVIVRDGDYNYIDKLMSLLEESNIKNVESGGVVIAGGVAKYTNESYVADVFEKADNNMYENKKHLKEIKA